MNEEQAIRHGRPDTHSMARDEGETEDLWRRAKDDSIPISEKIAHVLFGVTALLFIIYSSNEFAPLIIMFLWLVSFSGSRYRQQKAQIAALCALLQRSTE